MYQPGKYKKEDKEFIFNFIKEHPFASFVTKGAQLLATHIPVLVQGTPEDFTLYSHIANHNEQFEFLKNDSEALLIFQGPHDYISSSWYEHKDISTWDYSAVHVNAKISLQTREELESSLQKLVKHFEKQQENPLYYKDIPKKMREDHLPLITGFWTRPTRIQAIAKLHQGYSKNDINSITTHLENQENTINSTLSENIKKEHNARNK